MMNLGLLIIIAVAGLTIVKTMNKSNEVKVDVETIVDNKLNKIDYIKERAEWAVNNVINYSEYLNCALTDKQINRLRIEQLKLINTMINNIDEYVDYTNIELNDYIDQAITNIAGEIRKQNVTVRETREPNTFERLLEAIENGDIEL